MKKTLDILEEIYQATKQLGDSYEEEGGLLNDVSLRAVRWLEDVIQEAQEKDLISKDMAEDYQEALRDIMQNNGDSYDNTVERIQNLKDINNKHYEDIKEFDEKSKESLDLDNVEVHNSDKEIKNSNDTLDYIKGLMQRYQSTYDSLGAMGATDAFYRIGNEIKAALKRNGIDKETAKKLIKPLEDMRDNIFDENLQKQKMQEFYNAVESSFSKGNSNGKTILEKAVDKLNSGKEKGGKEADEKPKEEESKTKNMFSHLMNGRGKKQEKEVQEPKKEDIEKQAKPEELKPKESQIDKDSKEKGEKDKEKSVEEKTKEQQKLSPEEAMKDISSKLEQYEESYKRHGSALNDDTYNAWMDLTKSLQYAVKNKLLSEDQVKQVIDIHEDMRLHSINSDAQYAGIEKFKKLFNEEKNEKDKEMSSGVNMQQPKEELNKTAPEQQKANADNSVKNNFNMGQKQEKTDAQEKDIRNPNATWVQNNTLGDTEVRFNVKDSGLQQKREDLNPNINHEINHEINDKINHHNEHDVRQEPTVADWRGGIQKTKDLIQQQEKTAKLREAKNNVPNNQSEFDRDTMNNIAAWRRKMLQNG